MKDKDGHQVVATAKITVKDKAFVGTNKKQGPSTGDAGILASLMSLTLVVGILLVLTRKAKIKAIKY